MVIREHLLRLLPKQGHFFKEAIDVAERMIPAGPDHAQVGAAGAVLDYIQALASHHGLPTELAVACRGVSQLWHAHEADIIKPLFEFLAGRQNIRLLGATHVDADRCPLLALDVQGVDPSVLARQLCEAEILCSSGHFYAPRLLEAVGINPLKGALRISMAHYNDANDVTALIAALDKAC
jgi:selenocysteine lyase/cysteine desulfurase